MYKEKESQGTHLRAAALMRRRPQCPLDQAQPREAQIRRGKRVLSGTWNFND